MANIPAGYHSITPYLVVKGAEKEMEFMKTVFGAVETEKMAGPDGNVRHAEMRIGDSMVMIGEAQAQWQPTNPMLYIYVEDTDATYQKALDAGATSLMQPADQFYGDRNAGVKDQAGVAWWIATHKEDLTKEEMEKRAQAAWAKH